MTWAVWWPLLGAAIASSSLAIFSYFAWAFRWDRPRLNLAAELSLVALLAFLGLTGIGYLISHTP